jgi:hypothetical protein
LNGIDFKYVVKIFNFSIGEKKSKRDGVEILFVSDFREKV